MGQIVGHRLFEMPRYYTVAYFTGEVNLPKVPPTIAQWASAPPRVVSFHGLELRFTFPCSYHFLYPRPNGHPPLHSATNQWNHQACLPRSLFSFSHSRFTESCSYDAQPSSMMILILIFKATFLHTTAWLSSLALFSEVLLKGSSHILPCLSSFVRSTWKIQAVREASARALPCSCMFSGNSMHFLSPPLRKHSASCFLLPSTRKSSPCHLYFSLIFWAKSSIVYQTYFPWVSEWKWAFRYRSLLWFFCFPTCQSTSGCAWLASWPFY